LPRPRIDLHDLVRQHGRMASAAAGHPATSSRLEEVSGFGSNPGAVRMLRFVPDALPAGAAVVVALHGCTQTAAGYDAGTGWSDLASRHGFALLLPEQSQANNMNRCFNWFEPADTTRGGGEALSIRQMVARIAADHGIDPGRVFVTGLSAGGAMASAMLATYPEVFAAGAIIAGLPYGAAASMPEAFEAMVGGRSRPAEALAAQVRAASAHRGPWPRVAIWQGDADATVRPVNAGRLRQQWAALHGLDGPPQESGTAGRDRYQVWRDKSGAAVVESHDIAGMAHGVPLHPGGAADGRCGAAGPFMLDVGISSTHRIADFFGLDVAGAEPAATPAAPEARARFGGQVIAIGRDGQARTDAARPPHPTAAPEPEAAAKAAGFDPGEVIRRALTAAGLMKS